jgi:hypothetical protein
MDIYDTVIVLRTQQAVNAFARPKVSVGAELSVAAGPVGSGGALDMGFKDKSPAWAYTKSKGLYAGLQLDGTVMIERDHENERFYGRKIKAAELIRGEEKRPSSTDLLIVTIEIAEGTKGAWAEMMIPPPIPERNIAPNPKWDENSYYASRFEEPIASSSEIPEPIPEFRQPPPPLPRRSADRYSQSRKERDLHSSDDKFDPDRAELPAYTHEEGDIKITEKGQ